MNFKKTILVAALCALFVPAIGHAATIAFEAPNNSVVGQETLVTVKIHTLRDKVNTVSGTVIVDPKQAQVLRTYEGNSAITLWIGHPTISQTARGTEISFSGITPGGFQGDFTLFSFVVKPLRSGSLGITAKDLVALKNDGQGTSVSLTVEPAAFAVRSGNSTSTVAIADSMAPDVFKPTISRISTAFNGDYFVSFTADDKGTGIDHYEVAYAFLFGPSADGWKPVQSPLVLPEGAGADTIYIKAVDKAGNERIVSVAGPRHYATLFGWGILIAILALCARIFTKRRSSYLQR